ncbi:DUF4337 domain-containing protein [Pararobbsia silviterrae]|uniref:DUF4337 domain-containing protein n=1 Tax=Pararobbsia silviterrae TaxID=1792498 RepID=A0A494YB20_9BURK|nr:DUF4337 domain-containing protein [Pararobbsia silviterrae]RKP58950.1 DUF4337 domain-containing protein [Pararobbsia silviterrae]
MSDEFEVHGPHDHAVEHAAEHAAHGSDAMASRVAVMTAVLATVGAMVSYQSGNAENLALYYKNEAAIRKTEAANQWAYYQAKGEKQNLAELGAQLAANDPKGAAHFASEAARYKSEKEVILKQAETLEAEVKAADEQSEGLLHRHHRWAQSMMVVQISIALAAITLLVRKSWLQFCTYGAAATGIVLGGLALLGV